MSGSWSSDWATGDVVTAAEFRKSLGCVSDTTLGVATAAFTITSLPTTYAHLRIEAILRGDTAAAGVSTLLRLNGDTAGNYNYVTQILGSALASAGGAAQTSTDPFGGSNCPANTAAASSFASLIIDIPAYGGTTAHKQFTTVSVVDLDATTANMKTLLMSGRWKSTSAINAISIAPSAGNFAAGSRVSVYVMGS